MKSVVLQFLFVLFNFSVYCQGAFFLNDGKQLITVNKEPFASIQTWDLSTGELLDKVDFEDKTSLSNETLAEYGVPLDSRIKKQNSKQQPVKASDNQRVVEVDYSLLKLTDENEPSKSWEYRIEHKKKDTYLPYWIYVAETNSFIYMTRRKDTNEIYKKEADNNSAPELIYTFKYESQYCFFSSSNTNHLLLTSDDEVVLIDTETGKLMWSKPKNYITDYSGLTGELDYSHIFDDKYYYKTEFIIQDQKLCVLKKDITSGWIRMFSLENGAQIGSTIKVATIVTDLDLTNNRLAYELSYFGISKVIDITNGSVFSEINTRDKEMEAKFKKQKLEARRKAAIFDAQQKIRDRNGRISDYALALDQSGVRFNYRTVNSNGGFVRLDLYVTNTTSKTMTGTFEIEILGKGSGPNLGTLLDPVYRDLTGNKYEVNFCLQPSHLMEKQFDAKNAIAPLSNVKVKLLSVKEGDCP